jgi:hypothetical protein
LDAQQQLLKKLSLVWKKTADEMALTVNENKTKFMALNDLPIQTWCITEVS